MKFATCLTIIFFPLLLCAVRIPAFAQSAGSACGTANKVIYPTYTTGTNTAYVCDGAHLVALETVTGSPLQVGIGGGVSGTNLFSVNGNVGATKYCDYAGLNCFTAAGISGGSIGAPGSDRNVIYNSGGSLFADTGLNYTSAGRLGIGTATPTAALSIQTPNALTSGVVITDTSSQSAPNLQLMRSDGVKMLELKRGANNAAGQLSLYDTSGNETKLYSIGGLYVDTGQTSAIRLLPSGSDVYIENTTSSGKVFFAGGSGGTLTGNVIFNTTGHVGIGTVAPLGGLDVENPVAAASGVAYGGRYQQTLTAAANNDSLTALYINPTFTNGSYTGVANNGLIVASGNVGIGTATPTHLFEVQGGPAYFASGLLALSITPVNSGVTLFVGNGGATNLTFDKTVASGGTGNAWFSGGNVGIGTTSPSYALDLIHTTGTLTFRLGSDTTNYMYMDSGGVESHIYSAAARPFRLGANGNTSQLVLDSTGNVGIGTTTPLFPLDVKGTVPGATMRLNSTQVQNYLNIVNSNGKEVHFGNQNDAFLEVYDGATTVRALTVKQSSGNVGIGTTSPNAKLTVSGGGISTGSASNTDLAGQLTLVAGTKSYAFTGTYTGAPVCVASDTATTPVTAQVTTTASTLTLTVPGGANTDTFNYVCVARN